MTAAVRPGCNCAVDRAALDLSELPVLHRIAVFGIQRTVFFQVERTAIDLDHDEVILGKRAATDGQTGVLGNAVIAHAHQGRALHSNNAAVVRNAAALEEKPAVLNVNDIVGADAGVLRGILTHDGTGLRRAAVLDGDAVLNGQRGLARHGAAVEGVTVQVEGQSICAYGDILAGVRQQGHGRILSSRVDSCLQGLILDAVDLCHVGGRLAGHQLRYAGGQLIASRDILRALLAFVRRAVFAVVARLLRLHSGLGALHSQRHIVGILVHAAIAQQDVAVAAHRVGEGAGVHGGVHRAAAAVDKAHGRSELLPITIVAAVGERAVLDGNSLRTVCLVVEVHRHLCPREGAIVDDHCTVRIGVDGSSLCAKVAAGQRDVVHAGGSADIHALDGDTVGAVAVGQVHSHLMIGVPLTPHAQIVQLIGRDGDVLLQISTTGLDLLAGIAAERIGVDLQVALAAGNIGIVAVDGDIIRHVAVGQLAHIRAGTAHDGDGTGVGLVGRRQCFRQRGSIAALRTGSPVYRGSRFPNGFVQQLQGVAAAAQCRDGSLQRGVLGVAHLGHIGGSGQHRIPIILRVCGIVSVHRIGRISAALSTGGIIRRAAAVAAFDLLVAGAIAVLAVSDLQVIGVTAAVAVVGHARSVSGDDRVLGFGAVRHRSVRRRRQQRQHHYQRKQ